MTDHDAFDRSLTDRLAAAESRVPGAAAPGLENAVGDGPIRQRWIAVTLVAGGAVAAALVAATLLNVRITPPVGGPTDSPSASASAAVTASLDPTPTASPSPVPIAEIPGLLAVSRDGDVWVRRADGSELRQLTDDPNLDERPLTWLTDGSQLVITRTPNNDPYASSTVELIDPASGQLTELGMVTLVYSVPTWSPDDTRIAFGGDGEPTSPGIAILDLTDGSLTQLTGDGGHGTDAVSGPIWSPDGSLIAYQAYDGTSNDVLIVSVANGTVTSPVPDPSDDYPLRWVDEEGTLKLVFGSFRGTEENKFDARPWVVNLDGSDLQLFADSGMAPSLADPQPMRRASPDGRWIASSCTDGVCIEHADGDMPLYAVPNTEGWDLFSLRVSWTPGGDYLIYSRGAAERDVVVILPLPDGDPITITPDGVSESAPAWQPVEG